MLKFENHSNGRYYYILVKKDILNDWVLTIIRGGSHSRVVRHFGYNCMEAINVEIERLTKRRLKRGYTLIEI